MHRPPRERPPTLAGQVQAEMLRALAAREVLPLGALRPVPVRFRLCAATLRGPRAEVAAGRFREDLYFPVGRPRVTLPALRASPPERARLRRLLERYAIDVGGLRDPRPSPTEDPGGAEG